MAHAQEVRRHLSPTRGDAAQALASLSAEKADKGGRGLEYDTTTRQPRAVLAELSNAGGLEFPVPSQIPSAPARLDAAAANRQNQGGRPNIRYSTRGIKPSAKSYSNMLYGGQDDENEGGSATGHAGEDDGYSAGLEADIKSVHVKAVGKPRAKPKAAAVIAPAALPLAPAAVFPSAPSLSAPGGGPGYCRKDKSLGLLCDNFLRFCREQRDGVVSLDAAAVALGVERRRIYDVTNILEALDVVSRRNKNAYTWHGTAYLARTLKRLLDSALVDAGRAGEVVTAVEVTGAVAKSGKGVKSSAPSSAAVGRKHCFFGRLMRVVPPTDVPQVRARAAECPAESNPMFAGQVFTLHEGPEPGSLTLGVSCDRAVFPDPLTSYLSVPPLWLEPLEPSPASGRKSKAAVAAADSARAVAMSAWSEAGSAYPGGLPALRLLMGQTGAGFAGLAQPDAIISVDVRVADAAASVGVLTTAYTIPLSRPLPAPLSALTTPLGCSWAAEGPGRGEGREPTLGNAGDVECVLEEHALPFRLRSLPLLSEVLYAVAALGPTGALAWANAVGAAPPSLLKRSRRDRSLGVLTQRFLKLFLLDRKVVTLDFAAPMVIPEDDTDDEDGEGGGDRGGGGLPFPASSVRQPRRPALAAALGESEGPPPCEGGDEDGKGGSGTGVGVAGMSDANKLKVRRLYDIANVLCALRLIDRVYIRGKGQKKPAFRWRGPAYVEPVAGVPLPDWALEKSAPTPETVSMVAAVPLDRVLGMSSSTSASLAMPPPGRARALGPVTGVVTGVGVGEQHAECLDNSDKGDGWAVMQAGGEAVKIPKALAPPSRAAPARKVGRKVNPLPPSVESTATALDAAFCKPLPLPSPCAASLSPPLGAQFALALPVPTPAIRLGLGDTPGALHAPSMCRNIPVAPQTFGFGLGYEGGGTGYGLDFTPGPVHHVSPSVDGEGQGFTALAGGAGGYYVTAPCSAPASAVPAGYLQGGSSLAGALTVMMRQTQMRHVGLSRMPLDMDTGMGMGIARVQSEGGDEDVQGEEVGQGAGHGPAAATSVDAGGEWEGVEGGHGKRGRDGNSDNRAAEGAGENSEGQGRKYGGKRRRRLVPGELDLPRPSTGFIEMGMSASQGGGSATYHSPGDGARDAVGSSSVRYYYSPGLSGNSAEEDPCAAASAPTVMLATGDYLQGCSPNSKQALAKRIPISLQVQVRASLAMADIVGRIGTRPLQTKTPLDAPAPLQSTGTPTRRPVDVFVGFTSAPSDSLTAAAALVIGNGVAEARNMGTGMVTLTISPSRKVSRVADQPAGEDPAASAVREATAGTAVREATAGTGMDCTPTSYSNFAHVDQNHSASAGRMSMSTGTGACDVSGSGSVDMTLLHGQSGTGMSESRRGSHQGQRHMASMLSGAAGHPDKNKLKESLGITPMQGAPGGLELPDPSPGLTLNLDDL